MDIDSETLAGKRQRSGRRGSSVGENSSAGSSQGSQHPVNKKKKTNDPDCTVCCLAATEADLLTCAVCENAYHASCCGWGFTPSPTELTLLRLTGWVCSVCCQGAKAAFDKLQASQTVTSRRLLELSTRMELLEQTHKDDIASLRAVRAQSLPQHTGGPAMLVSGVSGASGTDEGGTGVLRCEGRGGSVGGLGGPGDGGWSTQGGRNGRKSMADVVRGRPTSTDAPINIIALVEKTVSNMNKKQLNLIVSGLKDTGSDTSDTDLFVHLCEEFLDRRPRVTKSVRLGKPSRSTNNRLLLVTLGSVEEASALLGEARRLREADDEYVRKNIFINRDLTKEEAKTSYDKRVERRAKAAAVAAAASGASVAAAAAASSAAAGAMSSAASCTASAPSSTVAQGPIAAPANLPGSIQEGAVTVSQDAGATGLSTSGLLVAGPVSSGQTSPWGAGPCPSQRGM
jgi:hypothetical protein